MAEEEGKTATEDLVSVTEAAKRLGVPKRYIRRARRTMTGPGQEEMKRGYVILEDVKQWLKANPPKRKSKSDEAEEEKDDGAIKRGEILSWPCRAARKVGVIEDLTTLFVKVRKHDGTTTDFQKASLRKLLREGEVTLEDPVTLLQLGVESFILRGDLERATFLRDWLKELKPDEIVDTRQEDRLKENATSQIIESETSPAKTRRKVKRGLTD